MVFRKSLFGCVQTRVSNFVVSGPTFTGLFSANAREESLSTFFPILYISMRSGDSRDRTLLKLSEIAPKFTRF